jgi:RNA polymerase sigma-70 factor (ECF subfamily)
MNILGNRQDAEESVNDAYLAAWNSIPPERPRKFSAFLGRIVRNISLNKYESRNSKKRGGGNPHLLFSELELCVPTTQTVENEVDDNTLARAIDEFLATLKQADRFYFVLRYWYSETIPQIARQFKVGESKVGMSLHRTRKKLKTYLEEKDVFKF